MRFFLSLLIALLFSVNPSWAEPFGNLNHQVGVVVSAPQCTYCDMVQHLGGSPSPAALPHQHQMPPTRSFNPPSSFKMPPAFQTTPHLEAERDRVDNRLESMGADARHLEANSSPEEVSHTSSGRLGSNAGLVLVIPPQLAGHVRHEAAGLFWEPTENYAVFIGIGAKHEPEGVTTWILVDPILFRF